MQHQIPFFYEARLERFFAGPNEVLLAELARMTSGSGCDIMYLWGGSGRGKTYLLQACMNESKYANHYFIPIRESYDSLPLFDSIEEDSLVCIDDIQYCQDKRTGWAILHLYESLVIPKKGKIIVSSDRGLDNINLPLLDLGSRLSSGAVYQVHTLDDDERFAALQDRVRWKKLSVNERTLRYAMNHFERNTGLLFVFLERLEALSISQGRKITIPMVKDVLKSMPSQQTKAV